MHGGRNAMSNVVRPRNMLQLQKVANLRGEKVKGRTLDAQQQHVRIWPHIRE